MMLWGCPLIALFNELLNHSVFGDLRTGYINHHKT